MKLFVPIVLLGLFTALIAGCGSQITEEKNVTKNITPEVKPLPPKPVPNVTKNVTANVTKFNATNITVRNITKTNMSNATITANVTSINQTLKGEEITILQ